MVEEAGWAVAGLESASAGVRGRIRFGVGIFWLGEVHAGRSGSCVRGEVRRVVGRIVWMVVVGGKGCCVEKL